MSSTAAVIAQAGAARTIGLVSAAHFFSHFYALLLPPLFPVLVGVYAVGFTEMAVAITVFSIATAVTQVPVGFLVDRVGARAILIAGLFLHSLAMFGVGFLPDYAVLLVLMALAGIANAVYHPANYAILSSVADPRRMGRAFSVHTFSGFLGGAVAPLSVITLSGVLGWQGALMAFGVAGAIVGVALLLATESDAASTRARSGNRAGSRSGMRLLVSLPVMMALLFFVGIALIGGGVGEFGVATLKLMFDLPLASAGLLVSAYLFTSPVGVLIGGWIADRSQRHAMVTAICFSVVAASMFSISAFLPPLPVVAALLAVAGLATGIVAPSRDMLIRSITPEGDTGKVFGFVSVGFNIGGIGGPLLFGLLLDHGDARVVLATSGTVALLTIVTVLITGRQAGSGRDR